MARRVLDLADLPTVAEQDARWEKDLCSMCAEPLPEGATHGQRYCSTDCQRWLLALRQKAKRLTPA